MGRKPAIISIKSNHLIKQIGYNMLHDIDEPSLINRFITNHIEVLATPERGSTKKYLRFL